MCVLEGYFSLFFFNLKTLSKVKPFLFCFPLPDSLSARENCQIKSAAYQSTTWAAYKLSASCTRGFFATVFLAEQGKLFIMNHLSDKFCLFPVGPEIAQVILKLLEANASHFF